MDSKKRILFAEDTKDLNKVVTAMLLHEGYEVDSAFDGEEASQFAENNINNYDAIILDIMMPKKDGLAVLSEIRGRGDSTPVMMLTAKAEIDDRVAGLDLGANDYLSKPFAMKELMARVRALIRVKAAAPVPEDLSFFDISLRADDFSMTSTNTVRLSPKEFLLMRELIRSGKDGLDSDSIYKALWQEGDADHNGIPDTKEERDEAVFLYVSYLRAKLSAVSSSLVIEGEEGTHFILKASEEE